MQPKSYTLPPNHIAHDHQVVPAYQCLSVEQMVTLAAAGVKVELAGPVTIMPEPVPAPTPPMMASRYYEPVQLLRDRYRLNVTANRIASSPFSIDGEDVRDPIISAVKHGDKFYVLLGLSDGKNEPKLFTDDANIFPSDALMANIHLYVKNG